MNRIITSFLMLFVALSTSYAQYITPGNGEVYSLDDLVSLSDGILTKVADTYLLQENLQIEAADTLRITQDGVLHLAPEVQIDVFGVLEINAPEEFLLDCSEEGEEFRGIRIEEEAILSLNNTVVKNGGGIRLLTELPTSITNSGFYGNYGGVATGGVVNMSRGVHLIEGNTFIGNDTPAIASAGNSTASPQIINNYFEANNLSNSNRPQINMCQQVRKTIQ